MQETLINLCIVTIIGNLALMGAWAAGGAVWQFLRAFRKEG